MNAAYLISVGGKYLVVLVSMVLVSISLLLRGQYWLSGKVVTVRRECGLLSQRVRDCVGVEVLFSCLLLLPCSSCFCVMSSLF